MQPDVLEWWRFGKRNESKRTPAIYEEALMLSLLKNKKRCNDFRGRLDGAADALRSAETAEQLLSQLPPELRDHALDCGECRRAAEDLFATRVLLAALPATADGGPWFAPRVMAAITAREQEMERPATIWSAVPRLASRLAWISAIVFVAGSTWLFEKPVAKPTPPASVDVMPDALFDVGPGAMSHDQVLVNLAERE
jgi:hypothetical protein